jgi:hypothetical protein
MLIGELEHSLRGDEDIVGSALVLQELRRSMCGGAPDHKRSGVWRELLRHSNDAERPFRRSQVDAAA